MVNHSYSHFYACYTLHFLSENYPLTDKIINFSRVMGTIAVIMPTFVIPVRQALGLNVNQNTKKMDSDLTPAQLYLSKKASNQGSA